MLTDSIRTSSSDLCGAAVGTGKHCFKVKCSTASHQSNRPNVLPAGIYLRSSASGAGHDRALNSPISDIKCFDAHKDAILSVKDSNPSAWIKKFTVWNVQLQQWGPP